MRSTAPIVVALAAASVSSAAAKVYFQDTFSDGEAWKERWVHSTAKGADQGTFELSAGDWFADAEADKGLRTAEDFRFYTVAAKLKEAFSNKDKDLVIQFSVKHEKREYSFCGGGYIKLLPSDVDLTTWNGDTGYHVMFGPDLCGYDVSRIHSIFNFKGDNLLKSDEMKLEYAEKNEFSHLYSLVIKKDKTYTVYFDLVEKASGLLTDAWEFPAKMIDDVTDKKPEDWFDLPRIPDPDNLKPEGYDDFPAQIPDPDAVKPDDWDDEDDGEWEPPAMANPDYKAEWVPGMIDNPDYIGEWKPKQVENPAYVEDIASYGDIGAVGFELWVVNKGSIFDNIFIGDDWEEAKTFAEKTFVVTQKDEKAAKEKFDEEAKAVKEKEEAEKKAEEDAKKAEAGEATEEEEEVVLEDEEEVKKAEEPVAVEPEVAVEEKKKEEAVPAAAETHDEL